MALSIGTGEADYRARELAAATHGSLTDPADPGNPAIRECDAVARAAFEQMGKGFGMTRELHAEFIDCSTLISQAHWAGAAIQTPFIAEAQRLSVNSQEVTPGDLLPGDCIFAYRSRHESPWGRHNHVAMYLGPDSRGDEWAIQSREPTGVMVLPLARAQHAGGFRRFCPSPHALFRPGPWMDLVRTVPKLGRLGARLTARYGDQDRHSGSDLYVPVGSEVTAPVHGWIAALGHSFGQSTVMQIRATDGLVSVIAPVRPRANLRVGDAVRRGEPVGSVRTGRWRARCNTVPGLGPRQRVHWELWGPYAPGCSPAPMLTTSATLGDHRSIPPASQAHNPLYALKLGTVGTPVSIAHCLR